ncbi:cathepsin L [Halyomorpha halys]|uniref:cathepsin L n=1 Tax=Halyomorpha halys TaxID=286706 RepID=UPI0006D4ED9B|nr:cathepsin L1-like [Halyomorpha halys]
MKIVLLIFGCFALTTAISIDEQWNTFKAQHKKHYLSASEEKNRLSIFTENMKQIEEHNAKFAKGEVTYSLTMNQFGDLSQEEFSARITGFKKNSPTTLRNLGHKFTYSLNLNYPDSIDWRNKGAVTLVKNQANCNGCWSFSATGAMEGQLFRATGKLVSLSEQQLIDCSTEAYGNKGCNGGRMEMAFQYIQDVGGIMSEDSYPFLGSDGMCKHSPNSIVNGSKVISYTELPQDDEEALKAAVGTIGPVSVAVKASSQSFQLYKGGIMTDSGCGPELDHAVLVVGYGRASNVDYWIVKNSWGPTWGEKGYIRIARNQNNTCGLATYPSFPILEKQANDEKPTTTPQPSDQPTTGKPLPSDAWRTVLSGHLLFATLFLIYFSTKF